MGEGREARAVLTYAPLAVVGWPSALGFENKERWVWEGNPPSFKNHPTIPLLFYSLVGEERRK